MISKAFMMRSARLMGSAGELRPGYINADSSGFEGKPTKIKCQFSDEAKVTFKVKKSGKPERV
jgi:hypothetical protein